MFEEFHLGSGHPWEGVTSGGYGSGITYYYCLGGLVHFLAPESVIEIGTGFGLGAATILYAGRPRLKRFVTVDLNQYHDASAHVVGNLDFARGRIGRWLGDKGTEAPECLFVIGNTQPGGSDNGGVPSAAPRWRGEGIEDGSIDLLFVDGKHTDDGAYNDLVTFWPKLKEGGVALVDDMHSVWLSPHHASHAWCDQVWSSFGRFAREREGEIAETHVWRYPSCGRGAADERPWGLIRKGKPISSHSRLHLITSFKPFSGEVGKIQSTALRSWAKFAGAKVTVLGERDEVALETLDKLDFAGVSEHKTALDLGMGHTTPLLTSVIDVGERVTAPGDVIAWINADVILTKPLAPLLERVFQSYQRPFVAAQRFDVERPEDAAPGAGVIPGPCGAELFAWPHGFFESVAVPPFVIGRMYWDNWLMGQGLTRGKPPVDATHALHLCHPIHDYSHFSGADGGAAQDVWNAAGVRHNRRLIEEVEGRSGTNPNMTDPRWIRL